jgi:hypothetical protein
VDFFSNISLPDAKYAFDVGKELFTLSVTGLTALAVLVAVLRISKVIEALKAFRDNSTRIWAMVSSIEDLKKIAPEMTQGLKALPEMTERLKALQGQVVAIQRNETDQALPALASEAATKTTSDDDWDAIKKPWAEARDQLERIIDEADGRRTRKYEGIARYSYADIITNLLADGLIDGPIAEPALAMNREFLALRPRVRPIDDNVKRNFTKWKSSFDRAVRNFKLPPPPSPLPQSSSPTPPPAGSNGQQHSCRRHIDVGPNRTARAHNRAVSMFDGVRILIPVLRQCLGALQDLDVVSDGERNASDHLVFRFCR